MIDLLREWAKIEPERCRVFDDNGVMLQYGDGTRDLFANPLSRRSLSLIQTAVQEAVRARQWHWSIESVSLVGSTYEASVDFRKTYEGNTPAEALLKAYLEALR